MTVQVEVIYSISRKDNPSEESFKKWVKAAMGERKKSGSVVINIIDEVEMTTLNNTYRKKNKPTNVLSFPSQLPEPFRGDELGDIAICASVVEREAIEQKKEPTAHWAHMVVHGVLHLLGYDHESEEDAIKMERIETDILNEMGFKDPFLGHIDHE